MRYHAILAFMLPLLVGFSVVGDQRPEGIETAPQEVMHDSTTWLIQPSFKYDVLTFLNALTGDDYYLTYYQDEYKHFEPLLTAEAKAALADLKRIIKDAGGGIISAKLTLYFSATDDETLDEMLATLEDSRLMQERLKATPYYSEGGWARYESVQPALKTIFQFLQEINFPVYWHETIRPRVLEKIETVEPQLPQYNVIREVESLLGYPLHSDTITVYMLYFSQPHGIRITGTRFLTDVAWPFAIVLRNAVHEMMHPPYDLAGDEELRTTLSLLKEDAFLMDKVENHNPSFGYNSFEGFVQEDVVQAMDQVINERLGVAQDPHARWKQSDDGMHVLAVALYHVMKEEGFDESGEHLRAFLLRQIQSGKIKPGQLKKIYTAFYTAEGK